jgi:hypothetical protein
VVAATRTVNKKADEARTTFHDAERFEPVARSLGQSRFLRAESAQTKKTRHAHYATPT